MLAPRLVDVAEMPPHQCIFTGLTDGPFIDTGLQVESIPMQNPRAYVHPTAAYVIGSVIGMVSAEEHEKALARVDELEHLLAEAELRAEEASAAYDAIDGLTRKGMVIRKQPGRKAQKKEPVA